MQASHASQARPVKRFALPGYLQVHIEIVLNYGKLGLTCGPPPPGKLGISNPVSVAVGMYSYILPLVFSLLIVSVYQDQNVM